MNKDELKQALEEYDKEKCLRVGHDWNVFNWIGTGTTYHCKRCGLRQGLEKVDGDGTVHYYPYEGTK